jgi:hypothetical protein
MAEIRVEPRERTRWPWILLGLALLALLVWWLVSRGDRENVVATETQRGAVADTVSATGVGTAEGTPGAVNEFIRFVEQNQSQFATTLSHQFTADGIRRLAAALGEITERDTVGGAALRPRLDTLRQRADALQRNEESTNHSRYARDAFAQAASIMDDLRQRQYPNVANEVTQVREAAQAIKPGQLLLEQDDEVRRFFERSGAALRAMANTQGSPGVPS